MYKLSFDRLIRHLECQCTVLSVEESACSLIVVIQRWCSSSGYYLSKGAQYLSISRWKLHPSKVRVRCWTIGLPMRSCDAISRGFWSLYFFFLIGKKEFHEELSIPEGKCSSLKYLTGDINTICLL